ncbi:hypothetical protein HOG48_04565 [Candidatus Peregrinibacteria bacterium]|jgi:hypothetical protein|nr:hypothetical protein [Candidatus Peregrinibacteria bacterium]
MGNEKYIGYLKYSGEAVKDGLLDTRKAGEALLGFDDILRFFLLKEDPTLEEIEFDIPVRIKKGSWEALIPDTVEAWILTSAAAIPVATYTAAIAAKAGTDGFLETGIAKDLKKTFKVAIEALQWAVKIASHVGTMAKKKFENAKIDQTSEGILIKITNDQGEILSVPKKYFDLFTACPEKLFSKNAKLIGKGRTLNFGVFEDGERIEVSITEKEKFIFCKKEDKEDILFPDLVHGQYVELEGGITRGNERTNTLGFEYKDHVLTCKPSENNIATYKSRIISQEEGHFFPPVRLKGVIDRKDKNGEFKEKRPMIIFSDIIPLEKEGPNQSLFDI